MRRNKMCVKLIDNNYVPMVMTDIIIIKQKLNLNNFMLWLISTIIAK